MRLSTACCVLLGFIIAVPLNAMSKHKTIRILGDLEADQIRGGILGLATVNVFSRCGIANQCVANSCPDTDCSGFRTTPKPDAKNQACSEPDFYSICMTTDLWVLGQTLPTCAEKGRACQLFTNKTTNKLYCAEGDEEADVNGDPDGETVTILQPTVPDSCNSIGLDGILNGHM